MFALVDDEISNPGIAGDGTGHVFLVASLSCLVAEIVSTIVSNAFSCAQTRKDATAARHWLIYGSPAANSYNKTNCSFRCRLLWHWLVGIYSCLPALLALRLNALVAVLGSWLARVFLLLLSALLMKHRIKSRSAVFRCVRHVLTPGIAAY